MEETEQKFQIELERSKANMNKLIEDNLRDKT